MIHNSIFNHKIHESQKSRHVANCLAPHPLDVTQTQNLRHRDPVSVIRKTGRAALIYMDLNTALTHWSGFKNITFCGSFRRLRSLKETKSYYKNMRLETAD